jgi:hypothetical protein
MSRAVVIRGTNKRDGEAIWKKGGQEIQMINESKKEIIFPVVV